MYASAVCFVILTLSQYGSLSDKPEKSYVNKSTVTRILTKDNKTLIYIVGSSTAYVSKEKPEEILTASCQ